MSKTTILIDNGHGRETAGKRSPDGRLLEYKYAREVAKAVQERLKAKGYDAVLLVPEETDVPLKTRCARANGYGRDSVLVSIHCNAASNGQWTNARGWSVFVAPNASLKSKDLAQYFGNGAKAKGWIVRQQYADRLYWVQSLAMCRDTIMPAVLTENFFQDNKQDVAYLLSDEGKEAIIGLHVEALSAYADGKV